MRKGFDERLASALNITHGELFRDYAHTPPAQAGVMMELPGPGREPWKSETWAQLDSSKKMNVLLYMLGSHGADVDRVIDFAIAMAEARNSSEGRRWRVENGKLVYDGGGDE